MMDLNLSNFSTLFGAGDDYLTTDPTGKKRAAQLKETAGRDGQLDYRADVVEGADETSKTILNSLKDNPLYSKLLHALPEGVKKVCIKEGIKEGKLYEINDGVLTLFVNPEGGDSAEKALDLAGDVALALLDVSYKKGAKADSPEAMRLDGNAEYQEMIARVSRNMARGEFLKQHPDSTVGRSFASVAEVRKAAAARLSVAKERGIDITAGSNAYEIAVKNNFLTEANIGNSGYNTFGAGSAYANYTQEAGALDSSRQSDSALTVPAQIKKLQERNEALAKTIEAANTPEKAASALTEAKDVQSDLEALLKKTTLTAAQTRDLKAAKTVADSRVTAAEAKVKKYPATKAEGKQEGPGILNWLLTLGTTAASAFLPKQTALYAGAGGTLLNLLLGNTNNKNPLGTVGTYLPAVVGAGRQVIG